MEYAYNDGYLAGLDGVHTDRQIENPYEENSDEFGAWEDGFTEASAGEDI